MWLNEGFASWIEYLCVDNLFPDFEIWTQFVNTDLAAALKLDALHTSHPIEVNNESSLFFLLLFFILVLIVLFIRQLF